ncbi:hypothetical protein [Rosistilla oblonga]|uniref:Uncharacterized protein n=1 Tax=Rosistilla oblonga TaxID=2527990 RepID=A0A518ITR6_9BACT|nr:hypothetical protein [Rosistilla oblonga]QDV56482.1 hypothetical protein Mal33_24720 [Rosistilla oblonga]
MSHTTELSLKNLHLLSPDLATDFTEQLHAAVLDCRQRPSLAEKREVTIKLIVQPHPEDPDDVTIQPVTSRKTPARKIDVVRARRTTRNQLQFDFDEEML